MALSLTNAPRIFKGPSTWTAETLAPHDWQFSFSDECLSEIRDLAELFDCAPVPIETLVAGDLEMPACRRLLDDIKAALTDGPKLALIDRLPLDDLSENSMIRLYWVLMSLIARPVPQKMDGSFTFTVEDTGQKFRPGSGVRPATTNMEQNFHNDNSFNNKPPEFVSLLCVHPSADDGGLSRLVSFTSVYNILRAQHPEVLERLSQPFYFDRQFEHLKGDVTTIFQSVFRFDEALKVRLGYSLIRSGYAVKNISLDDAGAHALNVLTRVVEDPSLWVEFKMTRGQIQIANNQETGHARTSFNDSPDKPKRRLERLWLRNAGAPTYLG
jgi:alpha-ketoglutarate-dependent taurine dioxygenase